MAVELNRWCVFVTLHDNWNRWGMNWKRGTVDGVGLRLVRRLEALSNAEDTINDNGIDTLFLLQLYYDQNVRFVPADTLYLPGRA